MRMVVRSVNLFFNEFEDNLFVTENGQMSGAFFETPDQLTRQMITMSKLPKTKWQNLLNLETIKVRLTLAITNHDVRQPG